MAGVEIGFFTASLGRTSRSLCPVLPNGKGFSLLRGVANFQIFCQHDTAVNRGRDLQERLTSWIQKC